MKNLLAAQCMDFSTQLVKQGQCFKFSLKMETFSFNLDITESRNPTERNPISASKRKLSPSSIARNARRKEVFLAKKKSNTSDTTMDSEKQKVTNAEEKHVDNVCKLCNHVAASPIGLEFHLTMRHKNILQIDGTTNDSVFMEDPETNVDDEYSTEDDEEGKDKGDEAKATEVTNAAVKAIAVEEEKVSNAAEETEALEKAKAADETKFAVEGKAGGDAITVAVKADEEENDEEGKNDRWVCTRCGALFADKLTMEFHVIWRHDLGFNDPVEMP